METDVGSARHAALDDVHAVALDDRAPSSWTWATRIGLLVAGGVAWEALARGLGSLMLPGPAATLAALTCLAQGGELWRALWASNEALVLGYGLAATVGVPLGLLLGRVRALGAFADVLLDILLATPMPAVIPLLVMATGIGLETRLLVVFLFAVAIIVVHAAAGARGIDPELVAMARAFGAGRAQRGRRIVLPATLPAVLLGLRLGLSRAISGMVAVELLLVAVGVGRLIERFQGDFDAPAVYAVVIVVVAEAVALTAALRWAERRLALGRAELAFE
jgi:ABC-type nitrate/sulfonate/bicarbonate transport system permease component